MVTVESIRAKIKIHHSRSLQHFRKAYWVSVTTDTPTAMLAVLGLEHDPAGLADTQRLKVIYTYIPTTTCACTTQLVRGSKQGSPMCSQKGVMSGGLSPHKDSLVKGRQDGLETDEWRERGCQRGGF